MRHIRSDFVSPKVGSAFILTLAAVAFLMGMAPDARAAAGAVTSFTGYEAESGLTGGGASVVSVTTAPTTPYSSPELEASGHAYVQLNTTGQYVQWTNNT